MSKVRINDLAREMEVKSRSILDALTAVGVTEKKTHSSSIDEPVAELVRKRVHGEGAAQPEGLLEVELVALRQVAPRPAAQGTRQKGPCSPLSAAR